MFILSIFDFIGRFHPVLVHLPIGMLLLACLFQLLTLSSKQHIIRQSIPLIYLFGALGAVLSSITGYFLSQDGSYDAGMVSIHQWLGISVSAIALLAYFLYKKGIKEIFLHIIAIVFILLITLTGHYGGSLTHGSDYLTAALKADDGKEAIPAIADVQKAIAYTHMIEPLLQKRCYSCHGAEKQKGKLRLDRKDFMIQGGENGKTLIPGNPAESEMIKRLLLPISNDEHMPPKEKPQLKEEEIALLKWWIQEGADTGKMVEELPQSAEIKTMLLGFQQGESGNKDSRDDLLSKQVTPANTDVIEEIKQEGVVVIPIHSSSNYLSVSFVTADISEALLKKLESIKNQLVYLDLSHTSLTDEGMRKLTNLPHLVRVNLRGTAITDKGLTAFNAHHKYLQYINLVHTKISANGLEQLKSLKNLQSIYLYQSAIEEKDRERLQKIFGDANLDFGDYKVPTLTEDTMIVK